MWFNMVEPHKWRSIEMVEIPAKVWRKMTVPEILRSLDVAVDVLEKKQIDKDWLKLLLNIGSRCIQIVEEKL